MYVIVLSLLKSIFKNFRKNKQIFKNRKSLWKIEDKSTNTLPDTGYTLW